MAAGLQECSQRTQDGGPVLDTDAEEELRYTQPNVAIALENGGQEQLGTLHITTRRLIWFSGSSTRGYAVDFPSLILHAISRNPEAYPRPCIYTQIDSGIEKEDDEDDEELDAAASGAVPDLSAVSEMRLIPEDASVLDHLFAVMSECAELNPDPEAEDEDGEGEFFYDEDEVRGDGAREAALDHFDSLLQAPQHPGDVLARDPHRFDDADEDEDLPTTQ